MLSFASFHGSNDFETAKKDRNPEDVGLSEEKSKQTKADEDKVLDDSISLTMLRLWWLPWKIQQIAGEDEKRGIDVGVIENREEEEYREETDVRTGPIDPQSDGVF